MTLLSVGLQSLTEVGRWCFENFEQWPQEDRSDSKGKEGKWADGVGSGRKWKILETATLELIWIGRGGEEGIQERHRKDRQT